MKVCIILAALCIAAVQSGIVDHTRCGGTGMMREMRIQDCEGAIAVMTPGKPYACEGDIITSRPAAALRFKVTAIYLGFPVIIIDTVLEGSSVQPGEAVTLRYTIVPNDILSGNTLPVNSEISNDETALIEVCATVQVRVE